MKKYLLFHLFCFTFCGFSVFAQDYTLDCQVIGSSGMNTNIDNVSFAGTVGEAFIKTYRNTDENIRITQGFHQPECTDAEIINPTQQFLNPTQMILYGNPIINRLVFETDVPSSAFTIDIVNALGQVLKANIPFTTNELNQLDCSNLASGMYWLKLSANQTNEQLTISFVVAK